MQTRAQHHICLSIGKHPRLLDGLGEFSYQLGIRLARQADRLKEKYGINLHFHLNSKLFGVFGNQVHYHAYHEYQKFFHFQPIRFDIWHTLHQHNRALPPLGSKWRMMTIHDLNFLYHKSEDKIRRHQWRFKRTLLKYDQWVAISQFTKNDTLNVLAPWSEFPVIYNGASNLTGGPFQEIEGLKSRAFFLHISRMAYSKNPAAILELAKTLPEKLFVLAGKDCPDSQSLKARAVKDGLQNVIFLFDVTNEEKAWLYASCEAFLFPSLTEGFGLPPIEAMHFGKPVFLSNRTCLPEVGGDAAFYWDDFDPLKMREVLLGGLEKWEREKMSDAIKHHASRYDWDQCAEGYLKEYLRRLNLPAETE